MNIRPRDSRTFATYGANSQVLSGFMSRVYGWMMLGLLITGAVAYQVGNNQELVTKIFSNSAFLICLILVQFGSVFFLSTMIKRISAATAGITFVMYSAITGLTFSVFFAVYTQASLASAFGTTAIGFGGLSLFGFVTKRDLGPLGAFCYMGLFGLIGFTLLSFFFSGLNSQSIQTGASIVGLLIFSGLTAYDTQKIKEFANEGGASNQMAILGALNLYLDFINMFLFMLRLMGDRK